MNPRADFSTKRFRVVLVMTTSIHLHYKISKVVEFDHFILEFIFIKNYFLFNSLIIASQAFLIFVLEVPILNLAQDAYPLENDSPGLVKI